MNFDQENMQLSDRRYCVLLNAECNQLHSDYHFSYQLGICNDSSSKNQIQCNFNRKSVTFTCIDKYKMIVIGFLNKFIRKNSLFFVQQRRFFSKPHSVIEH